MFGIVARRSSVEQHYHYISMAVTHKKTRTLCWNPWLSTDYTSPCCCSAAWDNSFSLPLDAELPAARTDGEPVALAIRPQYIHVAQAGEELFSGAVKLVEPQGDRDTVYLDVRGREIRAVVPQNTVAPEQEALSLSLERDKFWVFDESGDRLH